LKYLLNSHEFNKLLNSKMHTNTYFEFLYENIKQYDFLYIFEKLDRMHTYKTFFCVFFKREFLEKFLEFFKISAKNKYFDINISLKPQYEI
jgi:hypothetical protein